MSNAGRGALALAAVVVVVAVFLILQPSDEGTVTPPPTAQVEGTTEQVAPPPTEEKAPKPEPAVTEIEVVGGEPKGGVTDIDVKAGEQVIFTVTADAPEEVHVHGYDLAEEVGPDQKAAFDFEADLEGVYEIELEHSAVPIAELRVNP
jgi:hypothetical protein